METKEVLRDMVEDFSDRRPDGREVVDYIDGKSPPHRLGTSARLHMHRSRVAGGVRRPHDLDSARRAPLLHLYQGLVRLAGLPKARLIRVVADVGMQAESELPVGAFDL